MTDTRDDDDPGPAMVLIIALLSGLVFWAALISLLFLFLSPAQRPRGGVWLRTGLQSRGMSVQIWPWPPTSSGAPCTAFAGQTMAPQRRRTSDPRALRYGTPKSGRNASKYTSA
jgi:hypothetical protein